MTDTFEPSDPRRACRQRPQPSSTSTPRRCSSPRASCSTARRRPRRASPAATRAYVYSRFTNPTVTDVPGPPGGARGRRGLRRHRLRHVGDPRHRDGAAQGGRPRRVLQRGVRLHGAAVLPRSWRASAWRRRFVSPTDVREWEKALRPNTKLLFLETPSNPLTEISDIGALAAVAKKAGALLAVDNCFCTPALQRPLALGADLVIHSATKYLDGQGRVLGGAVLGCEGAGDGRRVRLPAHRRPDALAVQRLGDPEGHGDARAAHAGAVGARAGARAVARAAPAVARVHLPGPRVPSAARARQAAAARGGRRRCPSK